MYLLFNVKPIWELRKGVLKGELVALRFAHK